MKKQRKSPSGTTIPHSMRRDRPISANLPPEDVARLDALAHHLGGRRRALSAAIRLAAAMPQEASFWLTYFE